VVLINSGQFAWLDDVKVWIAEQAEDWPAKLKR
jgi:hypothetical protein